MERNDRDILERGGQRNEARLKKRDTGFHGTYAMPSVRYVWRVGLGIILRSIMKIQSLHRAVFNKTSCDLIGQTESGKVLSGTVVSHKTVAQRKPIKTR